MQKLTGHLVVAPRKHEDDLDLDEEDAKEYQDHMDFDTVLVCLIALEQTNGSKA